MTFKYRRRSRYGCFFYMLIPLALIGLGFYFRDDIGRWLDQITAPGPTQSAEATSAPVEGSPTIPPTPTEVLGPDGFPLNPRPYVLQYTVQPGDALLLIAERFNLSPDTIFWANPDTLKDNADLIQVGVRLFILPIDGVYHLSDGEQTISQIATEYGVTADAILRSEYNDLRGSTSSTVPAAGLHLVVPGGTRAYSGWLAPVTTGTGDGRAYPQGTYHPGSCLEHYSGIGGTGTFINPMGGTPYRVTQGFEPWHPGVDLAAERATPIYASDSGIVVFAGWHRDGYGNLVIIDHGQGFTTYYGHLNDRFVGCGDQVRQGQLIGNMGMTGNATGVHLHFEVREDDAPKNPYNFITVIDQRLTTETTNQGQ